MLLLLLLLLLLLERAVVTVMLVAPAYKVHATSESHVQGVAVSVPSQACAVYGRCRRKREQSLEFSCTPQGHGQPEAPWPILDAAPQVRTSQPLHYQRPHRSDSTAASLDGVLRAIGRGPLWICLVLRDSASRAADHLRDAGFGWVVEVMCRNKHLKAPADSKESRAARAEGAASLRRG